MRLSRIGIVGAFVMGLCMQASGALADALDVRYSFGLPSVERLVSGHARIDIDGLPVRDVAGQFRSPYRIAKILLPQGRRAAEVRVDIEWRDWIDPGTLVIAGPEFSLMSDRTGDTHSSGATANSPAPSSEIVGTFRLTGADILFVRLVPLDVDGESTRVRTAASMTVHVTTEPASPDASALSFRGLATDVRRIQGMVDNPGALDQYAPRAPRADTWDMLIVTNGDMSDVFDDYAAYKSESSGPATHVVLMDDILAGTSGDDEPEKLRNFVRDAYENHATRYLLLGGDADGLDPADHIVPARCLWSHAETVTNPCVAGDLYFGNLDGTWDESGDGVYGEADDGEGGGELDLLAEIFVGRIAADDAAEALRQLTKIRAYDAEDPRLAAILYGEKLWPAPPVWGDDLKDLAFAEMTGMTATRMYGRDGSYTADGLVAAINSDEHSIINASEHGNWFNGLGLYMIDLPPVHDQLPELANTYPFFGYSHGCYTGSFDNRTVIGTYNDRDAIAEELTTGMDAGAFAMIVNSREGFADWSETGGASSEFDIAFMHELFANNVTALGETLVTARETKIGSLDDNENANRWIFFDLNLLGDPHQNIKTAAPGPDDDADDDNIDDDSADDDAMDDDFGDDDADDDSADDDAAAGSDDDDDSGCGC